jgi:hypothetical protein
MHPSIIIFFVFQTLTIKVYGLVEKLRIEGGGIIANAPPIIKKMISITYDKGVRIDGEIKG